MAVNTHFWVWPNFNSFANFGSLMTNYGALKSSHQGEFVFVTRQRAETNTKIIICRGQTDSTFRHQQTTGLQAHVSFIRTPSEHKLCDSVYHATPSFVRNISNEYAIVFVSSFCISLNEMLICKEERPDGLPFL